MQIRLKSLNHNLRFLFLLGCCSWVVGLSSCTSNEENKDQTEEEVCKIAFGSCANQDKPQPILHIASNYLPNAFIFLGDNIYGDTRDMDSLQQKYHKLGAKEEFLNLRSSTNLYAVWDDHDYGENDAGKEYPFKMESKEIFMDFWQVPENSQRRKHKGIYGVEYLKIKDLVIQIILLDTRTFRDRVRKKTAQDTLSKYKNTYIPYAHSDSTILGEVQWNWLDTILSHQADIRIVASSIQFSHEYNGWESWTNFPYEKIKLVELIKKNKAEGLIFISGDVHWGEISKEVFPDMYPIYDITSSGITETYHHIESNKNRVGSPVAQNNFGMLTFKKSDQSIKIEMSLIDTSGNKIERHSINRERLTFK